MRHDFYFSFLPSHPPSFLLPSFLLFFLSSFLFLKTWPFYVVLASLELCVDQTGLKLRDPSAEITGMYHNTWIMLNLFDII